MTQFENIQFVDTLPRNNVKFSFFNDEIKVFKGVALLDEVSQEQVMKEVTLAKKFYMAIVNKYRGTMNQATMKMKAVQYAVRKVQLEMGDSYITAVSIKSR